MITNTKVKIWWAELPWKVKTILVYILAILLMILAVYGSTRIWPDSFCTTPFDCQDMHIRQCLESRRYTRTECIQIVSGIPAP